MRGRFRAASGTQGESSNARDSECGSNKKKLVVVRRGSNNNQEEEEEEEEEEGGEQQQQLASKQHTERPRVLGCINRRMVFRTTILFCFTFQSSYFRSCLAGVWCLAERKKKQGVQNFHLKQNSVCLSRLGFLLFFPFR